jgi:hypothetical protein
MPDTRGQLYPAQLAQGRAAPPPPPLSPAAAAAAAVVAAKATTASHGITSKLVTSKELCQCAANNMEGRLQTTRLFQL